MQPFQRARGATRSLIFTSLGPTPRGTFAAAIAIFALGFAAGSLLRPPPVLSLSGARLVGPEAVERESASAPLPARASALGVGVYPAEVIRVIDGDTFEARVHVWPGLEVATKVRLRDIDAPELHARCADEFAKAQAARSALQKMLAAGDVTISQVGLDKYGGRVDAIVATRETADVSAALLSGGFARSYNGGRRTMWCDSR